jgi:hypothetical protein
MLLTRPPKGHFSESEAAQQLGLSLEDLRKLVRHHVVQNEEDMDNLRITGFQPSDLVLLKLLIATRASV